MEKEFDNEERSQIIRLAMNSLIHQKLVFLVNQFTKNRYFW